MQTTAPVAGEAIRRDCPARQKTDPDPRDVAARVAAAITSGATAPNVVTPCACIQALNNRRLDMPHTATMPTRNAVRQKPTLMQFCEAALMLNQQPLRFDNRPYLDGIYRATDGNVVIRAGRQVEKSSYITFRIAYELVRQRGAKILLVCPRESQTVHLIRDRFLPLVAGSPILKRALGITSTWRPNVHTLNFPNGSQLFARSAFRSADAVRGISADVLFIDEFQDVAAGYLAVLKETLSHAKQPRTIATGTSKAITNHLEDVFAASSACAWAAACAGCGRDVMPDETSIGPEGYWCPACHSPIDWQTGRWVAQNPHSQWGHGFWIPQTISPWIRIRDLHEKFREYDHDRFRNEVLGVPTQRGALVLTRGELEACCGARGMARSVNDLPQAARRGVLLGVDWGSGLGDKAAVVIASEDPATQMLRVWHWAIVSGTSRDVVEAVQHLCGIFSVAIVCVDARGGGAHQNRALSTRLGDNRPRIVGMLYGDDDTRIANDGGIEKRSISKTKWIGGLVTRVREKLVEFPQSTDCQEAFSHVLSQYIEYDEENRLVKYRAADGRCDDLLHPLVYVHAARELTTSVYDVE